MIIDRPPNEQTTSKKIPELRVKSPDVPQRNGCIPMKIPTMLDNKSVSPNCDYRWLSCVYIYIYSIHTFQMIPYYCIISSLYPHDAFFSALYPHNVLQMIIYGIIHDYLIIRIFYSYPRILPPGNQTLHLNIPNPLFSIVLFNLSNRFAIIYIGFRFYHKVPSGNLLHSY